MIEDLKAIGKTPLSEKVYSTLVESIVKGTLPPGTKLQEQHVAKQLAVSATPVREAFRRMERDGFIESVPYCGVVVKELKRIKLPISLKTLGSIFIYPLVGTLVTGGIIVWGIGGPIAAIMNGLTNWLSSLGDVGKVPLASILGAMTAFDMGGPVNKVATLFAQTQVDTLPYLMGGVGVAICTPPIGMGIATLLAPKKYNVEEKEAGKAAILMGCVGITEGAIPFAANDPLRVIPSLIVGAVVGNIIPFLAGVLNHAPWGGLIVLPVVEGRIWYFIAVLAGGFVTALMVNLLKKNYVEESAGNDTDLDDLDEITFDEL